MKNTDAEQLIEKIKGMLVTISLAIKSYENELEVDEYVSSTLITTMRMLDDLE
ncbi:MAG: hypothetical protein KKB34_10415 [Bacteroidetes bacterium]|nr:hypothetical protein [Bacteroidota bacterium]